MLFVGCTVCAQDKLDKLYEKRREIIDKWDSEEYDHILSIEEMKKKFPEKTSNKPQKRQTLAYLISKGVEGLSSRVKPPQTVENNNKPKVTQKDIQKIKEAAHMEDYSSDSPTSSTTLFMLALLPAAIGLIIIFAFIVLLFVEVLNRTRPGATNFVYNDSISAYNEPIIWSKEDFMRNNGNENVGSRRPNRTRMSFARQQNKKTHITRHPMNL